MPANFLPFGNGDIVNPISDDGSSEAIYLQQSFKYFGHTYNQIYVSSGLFFLAEDIFFLLNQQLIMLHYFSSVWRVFSCLSVHLDIFKPFCKMNDTVEW